MKETGQKIVNVNRDWLLVVLAFLVGGAGGYSIKPTTWTITTPRGMGIYFEDGYLVVDGGREDGVELADGVDITLPKWIEDTLGDEPCKGATFRNFAFAGDYVVENLNSKRRVFTEGELK